MLKCWRLVLRGGSQWLLAGAAVTYSAWAPALGLGEINDRQRVTALALRGAIDAGRQIGPIFRSVGGFRYLWLTREIAREAIFSTGKLDPFLGERRSGNKYSQGCRNERHQAHDLFIPQGLPASS